MCDDGGSWENPNGAATETSEVQPLDSDESERGPMPWARLFSSGRKALGGPEGEVLGATRNNAYHSYCTATELVTGVACQRITSTPRKSTRAQPIRE